jgi:hypothetical protein
MRRSSLLGIGFVMLTFVGAQARAAAPGSGPEVAMRFGIAIPAGSIRDGTSLDSYAGSELPLVFEGGYRIDSSLFVGARFQYAFPQLKNPNGTCSGITSCSGSDVQLGVEGLYRFLAEGSFAPWVGLGFGYEWAGADYDTGNGGLGGTYKGFEAIAQGGGDVRVSRQFVLGPFVEVAFGRFDTFEGRVRVGNRRTETSADITDTAVHAWIAFGVRGAFGF